MTKHTFINCPYCGQKLIRLGSELLECQPMKDGSVINADVNDTYWCDRCLIDISIEQTFEKFDPDYLILDNS